MWRVHAGFVVTVGLAFASCAKAVEEFEDARKTHADIKKELGADSQVSWHSFTAQNVNRLGVTVRLEQPPEIEVATIKARVSAIVNRDFRAHVDEVTVDFVSVR